MALTKLDKNLLGFSDDTDFVKLPSGTTAQRPSSPAVGHFRFNTTLGKGEVYNGTSWLGMGIVPPSFSSIDYPGSKTAAEPDGGESIIVNGGGFNTGITVEVGGTLSSSVTVNSATQLTFTAPAKSAGSYNIVFTNTDAGTATAINAITYNAAPVFSTSAGSLGSILEGEAVNVTVAAAETDGGTVTFAVTSGSLPSGISLNSSTGVITGTAPSVTADTTSNFTITATDNENQTEDRAFSLTIQNDNPSFTFSAHTYTGTGATQTPSDNAAFKPDIMMLTDRQAGGQVPLQTSMDVQKTTFMNGANPYGNYYYTTFNSPTGYSIYGSGGVQNNNTQPEAYIIWLWKVNGGTTATNSDGNVNTTVQLNTAKGITMGKMSNTPMTSSQTFGHGMGSEPDCLWVINTDQSNYEKRAYFKDANSWDGFLKPNTTDSIYTSGINSTVNSSTFSLQWTGGSTNADWLFLAFKSIAGFSKFGTFTGSSNKRTPIHLGFAPGLVILKQTDGSGKWYIFDYKRPSANQPYTYNHGRRDGYYESVRSMLAFDMSNEDTSVTIRFAEGGFVLNGSHIASGTWSYMAWANNPLATTPSLASSFKTVTYTGNGGTQDITSVGFRPGLTWIKCSDSNKGHNLHDQIRAMRHSMLSSHSNGAENTESHLNKSLSNGFQVNSADSGTSNGSGLSYVAWNWKAAEHPSILTDGTIDSIVSANPAAGFSIVKWTTNGSANQTVAHGLSSTPEFVIYKRLDSAQDWFVETNAIDGSYDYGNLNSSSAFTTNETGAWSTRATSTTITAFTSQNNYNYIAYCWHSVSGYSKIGTYTGNGNATGPTVTTGFQPNFVLIKRSDGTSNWNIYDTARDSSNPSGPPLYPNLGNAQGGSQAVNFLSTGFQPAYAGGDVNENNGNYIYMAFKHN